MLLDCRAFTCTIHAVSWTNETMDAAWSPRYGHSACGLNGKLYLMAGLLPQPSHDIWVSLDGGRTWGKSGTGGTAGWTPRAFASLTSWQGTMYLFGGSNLQQPLVDFYSSTDGEDWIQLQHAALSPPARTLAPMLPFGGRLWLFPGTEGPSGGIWWTTQNGAAWTQVASGNTFGTVRQFGVAALPHSLLVVGGFSRDVKGRITYDNEVWNSTINLFCEKQGAVCGSHGYCTGVAGVDAVSAKCNCDPNYVEASNCTIKVC